jgi:SAM-dependent methyltransferase
LPISEKEGGSVTNRGALAGLRILECGEMVAAPYAAKLLAHMGADVVKVEPPEGDPARRRGPFPKNESHPERSGLHLYLNQGKRSLVIDWTTDEGQSHFRRLAANAALRCHEADVDELVMLFGRRRFDCAVSNNSFHEFWRPVRALREVRAVLKPSGTLLLAELTPKAGEAVDNCPRHSREKIVELLPRGGFAVRSAATRSGTILIRAAKA